MEVISLQSGSNGNSFYVKAGGREFLFDAGINGAVAEKRLAIHGKDIRDVEALFISHSHRDHSRAMGIFHRKYGHSVFVTESTLNQARRNQKLGVINDLQFFSCGESLDFGNVRIHTIPTPHDAHDSVAFIIEDEDCRLGILTDIGHAFDQLAGVVQQLDAVILESNYDPEMLSVSQYPIWLKRRVAGLGGHLSNEEAAGVVSAASTANLQWIALCHLSAENNDPELALQTHRQILGNRHDLRLASRHEVSDVWRIEKRSGQQSPWRSDSNETDSRQLSLFG